MFGYLICSFSPANPWLDFLPAGDETLEFAQSINDDLQKLCKASQNRFYAFGILPSPSSSVDSWLQTIDYIARQSHLLVGVIMGTKGLGQGLDDPAMFPIWERLQERHLTIFVHPHYGIGNDVYGPAENGHVLPLALGFPFETSIVSLLCLDSYSGFGAIHLGGNDGCVP